MKTFNLSTVAVLAFAAVASSALAGPAAPALGTKQTISRGVVEVTASRVKKPSRRNSRGKLKGNGQVVKDTCPGGDKKCIKDLIAACDKAGGGLSTEPDGGVDCYVVGIHDQP